MKTRLLLAALALTPVAPRSAAASATRSTCRSTSARASSTITGENATRATWYPSGELGYDIGIGNVLVRPYGGAGALARTDTRGSVGLLYPGLAAEWLIPRSYAFLGGDARLLVPLDAVPAVSLMGTAGLNF